MDEFLASLCDNRFPEENWIKRTNGWTAYTFHFSRFSNSKCWAWLKDPDLELEFTLEILNRRGVWNRGKHNSFPYKMKAFVCHHRPDLIGKIANLPRKLRRKYHHELALAKLDV